MMRVLPRELQELTVSLVDQKLWEPKEPRRAHVTWRRCETFGASMPATMDRLIICSLLASGGLKSGNECRVEGLTNHSTQVPLRTWVWKEWLLIIQLDYETVRLALPFLNSWSVQHSDCLLIDGLPRSSIEFLNGPSQENQNPAHETCVFEEAVLAQRNQWSETTMWQSRSSPKTAEFHCVWVARTMFYLVHFGQKDPPHQIQKHSKTIQGVWRAEAVPFLVAPPGAYAPADSRSLRKEALRFAFSNPAWIDLYEFPRLAVKSEAFQIGWKTLDGLRHLPPACERPKGLCGLWLQVLLHQGEAPAPHACHGEFHGWGDRRGGRSPQGVENILFRWLRQDPTHTSLYSYWKSKKQVRPCHRLAKICFFAPSSRGANQRNHNQPDIETDHLVFFVIAFQDHASHKTNIL